VVSEAGSRLLRTGASADITRLMSFVPWARAICRSTIVVVQLHYYAITPNVPLLRNL